MPKQVKTHAAKPEDLSSFPGAHTGDREAAFRTCLLLSTSTEDCTPNKEENEGSKNKSPSN